ncbi:MAG: PAS domain-containing protein [Candidatus Heimdallarchaeaceae archaeon]
MFYISDIRKEEFDILRDTFDVIFQNSPDLILLTDLQGSITDANIKTLRYFRTTLNQIRGKNVCNWCVESRKLKSLIEVVMKEGYTIQRLSLDTPSQGIRLFDVTITKIGDEKASYLVFICKDVHELAQSDAQRKFLYELFQHDLLNKLHAEIGFIDFFKQIAGISSELTESSLQLIEKVRDLTVRNIYLVQNINIMLMLRDFEELTNQNISAAVNHAVRYLKSFFYSILNIEIIRMANFYIPGDDYYYRIFVNLILSVYEWVSHKIDVEITIEEPDYNKEQATIILHFEDAVLSDEQKRELMSKTLVEFPSIKKLDLIVIQTLLERYMINIKVENIRRSGKTVGTRIVLYVPVVKVGQS